MTTQKPLKIVFAGTPALSATILQALLDSEHEVVAIYTQPDRPAGRGRRLMPSPVKQLAEQANIPVYQPRNLSDSTDQQVLQSLDADLMVVAAYGVLLPQTVLDMPANGCWNVHVSLLPRWRGAAPIQHAILAGDAETGVTIMQMDAGLDTGAILKQAKYSIAKHDTSAIVHDRLAELGAQTLLTSLDDLVLGQLKAVIQDDRQASYAAKLQKIDAKINWHESAVTIDRQIRAFNSWPMAYCELAEQTLRLWLSEVTSMETSALPGTIIAVDKQGIDVATSAGVLRLLQVQLPGKKAMTVAEILNGRSDLFQVGARFQ